MFPDSSNQHCKYKIIITNRNKNFYEKTWDVIYQNYPLFSEDSCKSPFLSVAVFSGAFLDLSLPNPCHLVSVCVCWGAGRGLLWLQAQQGSLSDWRQQRWSWWRGVMKMEKHVEIDVTARQIKTLPDAQALSSRGPQQSHPPMGCDSPVRKAKRCQMWRKPPGSLTPSPSNTVSIVLQHMLPVKGEKCRHQHMPKVFQA